MVTRRRGGLIAMVGLFVIALTLPALGGASAKAKTYNIYYSTSFNGNGFRVQAVNTM